MSVIPSSRLKQPVRTHGIQDGQDSGKLLTLEAKVLFKALETSGTGIVAVGKARRERVRYLDDDAGDARDAPIDIVENVDLQGETEA